jgi:flagellar motor switch protein FliN/FliY
MSQMIESFLHPSTAPGLRAQPVELGGPSAAAAGTQLLRDANPLHGVRVSLNVCVGATTLSVGELLQARERSVLVLDRLVEQPVDLLLDGKVVARGELVAVDGSFGVRLTELPAPLRI